MRQTETAAMKAASSDSRNKPFERNLAAVYTRATLEAGELAAARPTTTTTATAAAGEEGGDGDAFVDSVSTTATATVNNTVEWSNEQRSSFLICVVEDRKQSPHSHPRSSSTITGDVDIGVVAIECSTGEVYYSQFTDSAMHPELEARLMFTTPSEVLLVHPLTPPTRRLLEAFCGGGGGGGGGGVRCEAVDGGVYSASGALSAVTRFYGTSVGVDAVVTLPPLVLRALAHSLDHLRSFGLENVLKLGACFRDFSELYELSLSPNALQQLEILKNSDDGSERGSLLWLMDRTITAAGARAVRRWVSRPLCDVSAIQQRLGAVGELLERGADHPVLSTLPTVLKELSKCDVERILGRVLHRTSSPAEVVTFLQIFKSLYRKLGIQSDLDGCTSLANRSTSDFEIPTTLDLHLQSPLLSREFGAAADLRCATIAAETLASIDTTAAASGDMLKLFVDDARFPEVAAKRTALTAAEASLEELRPQLAATLNVRAVAYVSVANQGEYLVEVALELEKRAPRTWERVSSTKKVVRFRPPDVKQQLSVLQLAKEHLAVAAKQAWQQLQTELSQHYAIFRGAVRALAALDCLNGFAAVAAAGGYVCPQFVDAPPQLHIIAGRHPVLDVMLQGSFVPNDIHLGGGDSSGSIDSVKGDTTAVENEEDGPERCAVITGPNMGGKSCYIRTAALLAIMAQAGSFVPAASCRLHAFDAIFTRMGAADNLALGRSTFLEELGECSTILRTATPRSLAIVDELGRGTSTRDGQAIAAATLEYMVNRVKCLTLFVTHYPEVANIGGAAAAGAAAARIANYYMSHVVEQREEKEGEKDNVNVVMTPPRVTFLYKAVRGVAEASYGLNVARMAGLPETVIAQAARKAREKMEEREVDGGDGDGDDRNRVERLLREVVVGLKRIEDVETIVGLQKQVNDWVE